MFLVLKMGKTFKELEDNYGGFADWVVRFSGAFRKHFNIIDVQETDILPNPSDFEGIIVTGAHEMVTDKLGWSERTAEFIKKAVKDEVPLLGICYGHQLLAYALGGEVGNHPKGPEIGTVDVVLNENAKQDKLFKSFPKKFKAHATHTQSVLKLPEGSVVLASNDYEPVHAFRYGKSAWGVQFHPEFDSFVTEQYALAQKSKLKNPDKILAEIDDTPDANTLIAVFLETFAKD